MDLFFVKQPLSLAGTKSVPYTQQPYSSSSAMAAAVLQVLAFAPVVTVYVYVCVVGAQQETEPRQQH